MTDEKQTPQTTYGFTSVP